MPEKDKVFSVNIREYLTSGNDGEAGEPALVELLSGFSCLKNPDVERLKNSAIEFTKKINLLHISLLRQRIFVCWDILPLH